MNESIFEEFYKKIWIIRLKLARSCSNSISDREKLLTAQRIIDKIIFLYFLGSKQLIHLFNSRLGENLRINEDNNHVKVLLEIITSSSDFLSILNLIYTKAQKQQNNRYFPFKINLTKYQLYIPFLNDRIFKKYSFFEESSGKSISEYELSFNFNWSQLAVLLNQYNWLIDDRHIKNQEDEFLTPKILGYLFEKFVVTIGELREVSLAEFSSNPEELRLGNKKIGAFYTRDQIAHFICANSIWNFLQESHSILLEYQTYQDFFCHETLTTFKTTNKPLLNNILKTLQLITICDPAVGSGAFLLSAGNVLTNWILLLQSTSLTKHQIYEVRWNILCNNLFGVDIQEGAIDICKLRLWLWLIAVKEPNSDEMVLPNLDFNLRVGNSLYGYPHEKFLINKQVLINKNGFDNLITTYIQKISEYRKIKNDTKQFRARLDELRLLLEKSLNDSFIKALTNQKIQIVNEFTAIDEFLNFLEHKQEENLAIYAKLYLTKSLSQVQKSYFNNMGIQKTYNKRIEMNKTFKEITNLNLKNNIQQMSKENQIKKINIQHKPTIADLKRIKIFHWLIEFPDVFASGGFDVVVGNPPYGAKLTEFEKNMLKSIYQYIKSKDTAILFFERIFQLSKPKIGCLGLIVLKTIGYYNTYQDIRSKLLSNQITHLYDIGLGFVGVNFEELTILCKNKLDRFSQPNLVLIYRAEVLRNARGSKRPIAIGTVPQQLMKNENIIIFRPLYEFEEEILQRILVNAIPLIDITQLMQRSLYIPDRIKNSLSPGKDIYINKVPHISRYSIKKFTFWDLSDYHQETRFRQLKHPKLFFKVLRGNRLVAYIDEIGNLIPTEKLANIYLKDDYQKYLAVVLILMNSMITSFYVEKMVFSETTETSRVMDKPYIERLPIKLPDQEDQFQFFIRLANLLRLCSQWLIENPTNKNQIKILFQQLNEYAECACLDLYLKPHFQQYSRNRSLTPFLDEIIMVLGQNINFTDWWKQYLDYKRKIPSDAFITETENIINEIIRQIDQIHRKPEINSLIHYYKNDHWVKAIKKMFSRKF
ncbi:MAG: Eco57I restriction-modification methylase domain-containing protein [Candidatus Hodarchaeales archaeon]|jgi:hypothetical protein